MLMIWYFFVSPAAFLFILDQVLGLPFQSALMSCWTAHLHSCICVFFATQFLAYSKDGQLTLLVWTLEQGELEGGKGKEETDEGRLEWRRLEDGLEGGRWGREFWKEEEMSSKEAGIGEGISGREEEMWEGKDEKGGGGREIWGSAEADDIIRQT